jgi:putative ABC transport system permease protein
LPDGLVAKVAAVTGVAHVAALRSADATVVDANGQKQTVTVRAITTADAAAVLRDQGAAAWLADGSVLLPAGFAAPASVTVQAVATDAPAASSPSLRARVMPGLDTALVTPATMDKIAPAAPPDTLFVALDARADPAQGLRDVQSAVGDGHFEVQGLGAQRAQYDRVINVLLAVVVGLLGVAVLIALLGVTNTLSLSVLERRRESATLRAIGLTRGRLRATLAIEGMLIAGVGAVLGIAFGLVYGWAGAATLLGRTGWLTLAVSWRDLGLVLAVAILAGLLASVLPARSAARTPPVAALAEE